jgi:hypothetical protein
MLPPAWVDSLIRREGWETPGGVRLAFRFAMVIPLFPRLTGFKVENLWRRGSRGAIRCTARLSRPLRAEEVERIERLPRTSARQSEVVHDCFPEELEHWHERLVDALAGVSVAPPRRAAIGERRAPRPASKPDPDPKPPAGPAPAA